MRPFDRRSFLSALGAVIGGCAAPGPETGANVESLSTGEWFMAGYDAANTGYVATAGPSSGTTVEWRKELDSRGDIVGTPVVKDGTVYVGSGQMVYSLSLAAAEVKWSTETDGVMGILSSAIIDDVLLVGRLSNLIPGEDQDNDRLLGVGIDTGEIRWSSRRAVSSVPTVADDRIFFGARDEHGGHLVALDGAGEEIWAELLGDDEDVFPTMAAPAVTDDLVYVIGVGSKMTDELNYLFAVDHDGRTRWQFTGPGRSYVNPADPTVDDESVYFGTSDGSIHALHRDVGLERWSARVEGGIYSSPAVDGENIYFGTMAGQFYSFDKTTGEKNWEANLDAYQTNPVVSDEAVYAGGESLVALSTEDGGVLWDFDIDDKEHAEYTSPVVLDGSVIAGICAKEDADQYGYENFLISVSN